MKRTAEKTRFSGRACMYTVVGQRWTSDEGSSRTNDWILIHVSSAVPSIHLLPHPTYSTPRSRHKSIFRLFEADAIPYHATVRRRITPIRAAVCAYVLRSIFLSRCQYTDVMMLHAMMFRSRSWSVDRQVSYWSR